MRVFMEFAGTSDGEWMEWYEEYEELTEMSGRAVLELDSVPKVGEVLYSSDVQSPIGFEVVSCEKKEIYKNEPYEWVIGIRNHEYLELERQPESLIDKVIGIIWCLITFGYGE